MIQPGAEPTNLLDRIRQLAGSTDQRVELMAPPLARGHSRTNLGVLLRCRDGQSGGYAHILFSLATGTSPS